MNKIAIYIFCILLLCENKVVTLAILAGHVGLWKKEEKNSTCQNFVTYIVIARCNEIQQCENAYVNIQMKMFQMQKNAQQNWIKWIYNTKVLCH